MDTPLKISDNVAKSTRLIDPSSFRSEHRHAVEELGKAPKHTANDAKSTRSTLPPEPLMSPHGCGQPRVTVADSNIDFGNPDFVKYAESFGAKGYRVESVGDLVPTLRKAIADDTVVVIDCPVDYSENMKLTEKLGNLICPI